MNDKPSKSQDPSVKPAPKKASPIVHSAPDVAAAPEPIPMIAMKTADFNTLMDIIDDIPHGFAKKIMGHINKTAMPLQVNLNSTGQ